MVVQISFTCSWYVLNTLILDILVKPFALDVTPTPVEPSPEVLAVAPAEDTASGAAIPPSTPSSQDAVMAATSSSSTSVERLTSVTDATASATDATSSLTNTFASHAMQYGDMAALDLVHYSPAGFFPWLIEVTHVSTALPLWSVIIVTTLGARLFLLPFVIRATRTSARLAPLQPQLAEIRAKVDKARVERDTLLMQQAMLKQQSLFSKAGVNPFDQIFMSVLQIAVQFGFFIGLRRMCTAPVEQFKDGGFGFIMDLTAPDPYFILPVLNTILVNAQLTVCNSISRSSATEIYFPIGQQTRYDGDRHTCCSAHHQRPSSLFSFGSSIHGFLPQCTSSIFRIFMLVLTLLSYIGH